MKNDISWHNFSSLQEQSLALAQRVAEDLKRCLEAKQQATLCVPGGNTPAIFLTALSQIECDWSRVTVLLNDERWVSLNDPQSNLAMLKSKLQQHKAKAAKLIHFYPLLGNTHIEREQFVKEFNTTYFKNSEPLSIDICVLGMGEDGHIASLFPDMPNLLNALDTSLPPALISADPPNKEARVTLNLSALLSAQNHYLLMTGKTKQKIIQEEQMSKIEGHPIGHLMTQTSLAIYYSN